MAVDIGPKIGIDGEAEFRKQINQITQQIKTFGSELAAVSSEFGANEKSIEALNAKNGVLNKAIGAQESKLKELRKGLEASAQKYGENDTKTLKWAQAVNNATADLNKLKNQVKQNDSDIEDLSNNVRKAGGSMDEAGGKAASFGDILKASIIADVVTSALSEIIGSVKELGQAIVEFSQDQENALKKTTAYFGETGDAAKQTEQVIKDVYSSGAGDSIDQVAEAVLAVKKNLDGLSETDLQNLTQQALTLDNLYGIDMNETLRGVNSLMQQFGLDSQTAMDYIVNGTQNGLDKTNELGDNLAEYAGKFAQAGYSAEEYFQLLNNGLDGGAYNLDKVNDAINEVTTRLADGTLGDAIGSYNIETQNLFSAWKKGEATQKEVIDSIVKDIQTTESQQEALNKAATAFGTMAEDGNLKFIGSLTSVGDAYTSVTGKAQKLVSDTTTNSQKITASMRTVQEEIAPIGDAISEIIANASTGMLLLAQNIDFEEFAGSIQTAFEPINEIFQGISDGSLSASEGFDMITKAVGDMLFNMLSEIASSLPEFLASGIKLLASLQDGIFEAAPDLLDMGGQVIKDLLTSLLDNLPEMMEAGVQMTTSLIEGVLEKGPDLVVQGAAWIIEFIAEIGNHLPEILETGYSLMGELIGGILNAIPDLIMATPKIIAGIVDTLLEYDWIEIGKNILEGLAKGILGYVGEIVDAAREASGKIKNAFVEFFDIHSPSRVMRDEVGRQITAGIAEGILADKKYAKKSAEEVSKAIVDAAQKQLDNYKVYNDLTLAEEAAFWEEMRLKTSEGTQARIDADKKYLDAKKKLDDQLLSREKAYKDGVSKVYKELKENIQEAWDSYHDQIDSVAESISSQMGLFDKFEASTEKSTGELLENLQSQVEGLSQWRDSLNALKDRGLPKGLIEELENLGTSAAGEVALLTEMTDDELEQYASLWGEKNALARQAAEEQLEPLLKSTQKQIESLRADAREELQAYQDEYIESMQNIGAALAMPLENIKNQLVQSFVDIVGTLADTVNNQSGSEENKDKYSQVAENIIQSANGLPEEFKTIGEDTIAGIIEGLNNKSFGLYDTIADIMKATIAAAQQAAQIHSPSRIMRDFIGKNMMAGLAEGMEYYKNLAVNAASVTTKDVMEVFKGNYEIPRYANGTAMAYDRMAERLANMDIVLNDGTLVGKLSPKIDQTLGGYTKLKGRYFT